MRSLSRPVGRSLLIFIALGVGCRHADLAEKTLQRRVAGMNNTLAVAAESERSRPAKLAHAFEFIDKDTRGSARRLEANVQALNERLEFENERWRENQSLYREKAAEIFGGKPENIEPAAIILFL